LISSLDQQEIYFDLPRVDFFLSDRTRIGKIFEFDGAMLRSENTKGVSITEPLTSCLTGLESAV
jgi:hypothetical protein